MSKHLSIYFLFILLALAGPTHGQDLEESQSSSAPSDSSGVSQVEDLYEKEEAKQEKAVAPKVTPKVAPKKMETLSDLATLAPFSDVAVIQKRFLPKTNRFEFSATGFTNLNNPFFNALGANLRLAYYLRERYALAGVVAFQSASNRQVTDDLRKNRSISTDSVVTSKSFFALALKWNPVYGKITLLNKNIVPFDLNFDVGIGSTQTTDGQSAPTLHFSTCQVFALSKSTAFRWEFILNTYQADGKDSNNVVSKMTQNDLFLGVGMSFYFPEATYR